jgi:hypothetical protein
MLQRLVLLLGCQPPATRSFQEAFAFRFETGKVTDCLLNLCEILNMTSSFDSIRDAVLHLPNGDQVPQGSVCPSFVARSLRNLLSLSDPMLNSSRPAKGGSGNGAKQRR